MNTTAQSLSRNFTVAFLMAALALAASLAQSPAWAGSHKAKGPAQGDGEGCSMHGKNSKRDACGMQGKRKRAHFLAPGVMPTVLEHANSKQRVVLETWMEAFHTAKGNMAKLMKDGNADKGQIKKARAEIVAARKELAIHVGHVIDGSDEAREAVEQRRQEAMVSKYFMHHEAELKSFSAAMSDGGDKFMEGILGKRSELREVRKQMKGYQRGVDYGKLDEARTKKREIVQEQQQLVRAALTKNPNLREGLMADIEEMHKHRMHGKHGKHGRHWRKGAHFLAPGVMRTALEYADSKQRRGIKKQVRAFRSAKKDMAKLMKEGKGGNKAKVKETRAKINAARKELAAHVEQLVEGNDEARKAVEQRRQETMVSVYFMHHEEELKKFSAAMSDDGDDFKEDILDKRSDLSEVRKQMKGYRRGVDYGKIDEARVKMRKLMEKQQKLVREALAENPTLREGLMADIEEMHESHRGGHGGVCPGDGNCDCKH